MFAGAKTLQLILPLKSMKKKNLNVDTKLAPSKPGANLMQSS